MIDERQIEKAFGEPDRNGVYSVCCSGCWSALSEEHGLEEVPGGSGVFSAYIGGNGYLFRKCF